MVPSACDNRTFYRAQPQECASPPAHSQGRHRGHHRGHRNENRQYDNQQYYSYGQPYYSYGQPSGGGWNLNLGNLLPYAVPAVAGFALGRVTGGNRQGSGIGSLVVPTAATLLGYKGGSYLGDRLADSGVGNAIDNSGLGRWFANTPVANWVGGEASGLLKPLSGFAGALLGVKLVGGW